MLHAVVEYGDDRAVRSSREEPMTSSDFQDHNGYWWQAELGDDGHIWAGATITVTAPTGESHAFSVNQVFASAEEASTTQGQYSYPITAAEQALIDQCTSAFHDLDAFISVAVTVESNAESIASVLKYSLAAIAAVSLIPVVGEVLAPVNAVLTAVDLTSLAITEAALGTLVSISQQAAVADLQLREIAEAVQNHSWLLADAHSHLAQVSRYSLENFWQALANIVRDLSHL